MVAEQALKEQVVAEQALKEQASAKTKVRPLDPCIWLEWWVGNLKPGQVMTEL
jgi:hypothetical protein